MVICLSSIFSDPLDETGVAALTSLPRKDWAEVSVYPWKQYAHHSGLTIQGLELQGVAEKFFGSKFDVSS